MQYNKPAFTIAQQIAQLESRGLFFPDKRLAEQYLSNISYYRLEGYWWPLQSDKINHIFKPNSRFDTVIDIYDFDRELRLIVLNMIERIEIGLRTRLIYQLSLAYGPWWFEDVSLFSNAQLWQKHLDDLKKEIDRSHEVFIGEHFRKYATDSRYPPAWKSLEVISFGLLSKLYKNLRNNLPEKDLIAKSLGTGNHTFLESWLQLISVVRNIAAHHGRLWNRRLSVRPRLLKRAPHPWLSQQPPNANSIYVALCCMKYLLHAISPNNHFATGLAALFANYSNIDLRPMGFPSEWKSEPLWR